MPDYESARISRLEHRLKLLTATCVSLALGCTGVLLLTVRPLPVHAQDSPGILRVRGLIIEDTDGRPRIILGAPVPTVKERKRTDPATGLILLSEDGTDRMAIGYPAPAPQVEGKVSQRVDALSGITIDDADGNERGGFGFLDNGTVSLGLDYANAREAVMLSVAPKAGFAGLTINAPQGPKSERAEVGVLTDGTSLMKLADTTGSERAMLIVQGENPAKLLGISPGAKSGFDVDVSLLNPPNSKHLTVETGQRFMEDIRNTKP